MTLADLISIERVVPDMVSQERWPAIVELVDRLVETDGLPRESRDSVLEALRTREEQRSTGIGNGVAIPHCFSQEIEKVALAFGRSSGGIEFCALDRAPVFFVVLFVVPESEYALHLKTLAAIARTLNSAGTRESLRNAESPTEIVDVLTRRTAEV